MLPIRIKKKKKLFLFLKAKGGHVFKTTGESSDSLIERVFRIYLQNKKYFQINDLSY